MGGPMDDFDLVSYETAIGELDVKDQASVNSALADLALNSADGGRYANLVVATQGEHRVRRYNWRQFFVVVLTSSALSADLRQWARDHLCDSEKCKFELPLVRATPRADLSLKLQSQPLPGSGDMLSVTEVDSLLDDLEDPYRWHIAAATAGGWGLDLSLYTAWATFSLVGAPYGGLPTVSTQIACALGFDEPNAGGVGYRGDLPLLIIEYASTGIEPKYPTMIEAWANETPNYYFMPAPVGQPHGWTHVWPNDGSGQVPRPEVVHPPAPVGSVVSPMLSVM